MRNAKAICAILVVALVALVLQASLSLGARPTTSQPTQILAYYTSKQLVDYRAIWTGDWRSVSSTHIVADSPVLFTVSVDVGARDATIEKIRIVARGDGGEFDYTIFKSLLVDVEGFETVTFASTNMTIEFNDYFAYFDIRWNIMVQGSPGTVVTALSQ